MQLNAPPSPHIYSYFNLIYIYFHLFSMKRKTVEIRQDVVRTIKKNKTQVLSSKDPTPLGQHGLNIAEIVANRLVTDILDKAALSINTKANDSLINMIIQNSMSLTQHLSSFACPQVEQFKDDQILMDAEPAKVAYDPICGFDKLITVKNQMLATQDSQFADSKMKPFAVYQTSKKQQQSIQKLEMNTKLVPLESLSTLIKTKSERQNEKQQTFYRDRIFENGLPTITPSQSKKTDKEKAKNTKIGFDVTKQSSEEYVFDYKGEKFPILNTTKSNANMPKQSSGNVLRTTCRVLDVNGKNDKKIDMPIARRTKGQTEVELSKEVIKNPNLKHEDKELTENSFINSVMKYNPNSGQAEQVKSILEASFREKEGSFRPIEKLSKPNKIL